MSVKTQISVYGFSMDNKQSYHLWKEYICRINIIQYLPLKYSESCLLGTPVTQQPCVFSNAETDFFISKTEHGSAFFISLYFIIFCLLKLLTVYIFCPWNKETSVNLSFKALLPKWHKKLWTAAWTTLYCNTVFGASPITVSVTYILIGRMTFWDHRVNYIHNSCFNPVFKIQHLSLRCYLSVVP